ncbi:hypothetical protein Tsp_05494 [Trichinella spiralis]|uniref:hypothetical protein n=1 Tax=Trichinella spiralis TaxID=6334 RepID=UPI0001EFD9A6|nr:hypothetical protein Tsp_05494 [Trichinella spiralis]
MEKYGLVVKAARLYTRSVCYPIYPSELNITEISCNLFEMDHLIILHKNYSTVVLLNKQHFSLQHLQLQYAYHPPRCKEQFLIKKLAFTLQYDTKQKKFKMKAILAYKNLLMMTVLEYCPLKSERTKYEPNK